MVWQTIVLGENLLARQLNCRALHPSALGTTKTLNASSTAARKNIFLCALFIAASPTFAETKTSSMKPPSYGEVIGCATANIDSRPSGDRRFPRLTSDKRIVGKCDLGLAYFPKMRPIWTWGERLIAGTTV
jgi:hypothetical protein